MSERSPGSGRYAHPEREQRWLLATVPNDATRSAEIHDWYILGTRLRLRMVDDGSGQLFKLAQKVRADRDDPESVSLTNMYLDRDEYERLRRVLPGRPLRKTRWNTEHAGRHVAIDEFHDQLEGLVLAETELDPAEDLLPKPDFAVRDVTSDDRYSGGRLASANATEIEQVLQDPELS